MITLPKPLTTTERQQRIIELIWYDPDTGVFRWRDCPRRKKDTAGSWGTDGYLRIMVDYRMYSAAPLGWFLYYREWPVVMVDHKDRNTRNNRIWNFRLANHSLNGMNSGIRVDNSSGVRGVTFDGSRYRARLVRTELGKFDTLEEATQAYRSARNAYTNG